jgi:hypothetical protein
VTDIGKKSPKQDTPALEMSKRTGLVVYPKDVPTGGYVAVRIKSCLNLSCDSQSSARRLVEPHQFAQWYWRVSATAPGPALISLKVDTYKESSAEVLSEEIVLVNVKVRASSHYTPTASPTSTQLAVTGGGSSNGVTIMVAVIGGVFAVIAAWVGAKAGQKRRRRRGQAPRE